MGTVSTNTFWEKPTDTNCNDTASHLYLSIKRQQAVSEDNISNARAERLTARYVSF
jgi:hypothetical protein